jgi:hypothetical protein
LRCAARSRAQADRVDLVSGEVVRHARDTAVHVGAPSDFVGVLVGRHLYESGPARKTRARFFTKTA